MSIFFQSLGFAGDFNQKGYTDYGKSRSNTGVAFHSGVRAKQIDVPNDARDLWIRFDIWMSDKLNTRWRVYQEQNGYTDGITEAGGTNVNIWSSNNKNNESKLATAKKDEMSGLHSYVLHMKSDKTNGIVEYWRDGKKIDGVTGNCNNGLSFDCLYLQTDGFGSQFSNVIVAPTPLTCNDQADRGNILDLQALTKNADWDKDAFAVKRSNGNDGDYMLYGDVNWDNYCSMASGRSAYFKLAGQGAIEKFRAYFRDPLSYSGLLYCSDDDKNYVKVSDFSCSNTYYVDIDARNQQHTYWRIDVAKVTGNDGFDRVAIYGAQQPATHRDAGEKVNVTINADISRTIKTEEKSELYDKRKAVWSYHNDGHKAGMPDYVQEVEADAEHSHTGCAIYQTKTQDSNMFGMPQDTTDFWAEFDCYYDGSTLKAYDCDNTGFSFGNGTKVWLNDSNVKTTDAKGVHGLHHYTIHMSTSKSGYAFALYIDGQLITDYASTTPRVSGEFSRWSILSGSSGMLLSNISIYVMKSDSAEYGWIQPILASNGTMGQDNFAVTSNFADNIWSVFAGYSSGFVNSYNEKCHIDCFIKDGIALHGAKLTSSDGYLPSAGTLFGSNDGNSWTQIGSWDDGDHYAVVATADSSKAWYYIRLESTARCSARKSSNADVTTILLYAEPAGGKEIETVYDADITRQVTIAVVTDSDIIRKAIDGKQVDTYADIRRIGMSQDDAYGDITYYECAQTDIHGDIKRMISGARGFTDVVHADIDYSYDGPGPIWHPEPRYTEGIVQAGDLWSYYNPGVPQYINPVPKGNYGDPDSEQVSKLEEEDWPNKIAYLTCDDPECKYTHSGKGISIYVLGEDDVSNVCIPIPKWKQSLHLSFYAYLPEARNGQSTDARLGFGQKRSQNECDWTKATFEITQYMYNGELNTYVYWGYNKTDINDTKIASLIHFGEVNHFEISTWHGEDGNYYRIYINGETMLDAPYEPNIYGTEYLYFDCGYDNGSSGYTCASDEKNGRIRLRLPEGRVILSDIVATNCAGIPVSVHSDISHSIVSDEGRMIARADIARTIVMTGAASADIVRNTMGCVSGNCDILRETYGGISTTDADITRGVMVWQVEHADILVRVPWDTTIHCVAPVAPGRKHTDPFEMPKAEPKEGVQSIEIALNEMCLSDTFTLVTTQPINISDQIRGKVGDFEYQYCAESTEQKDKLITVQGMYGYDNLVLRPIDIGIPQNRDA